MNGRVSVSCHDVVEAARATQLARPGLNARQARTVTSILDAGSAVLRAVGLDALTVRTVALRAGVSPATAYTYFDSKDHLFAEMFWRHLCAHPSPALAGDDAVARLSELTKGLTSMLADCPEMAAAATRALLGTDPAVERLRVRISGEYRTRFQGALGPTADRNVLNALLLTFSGALLQTGMGLLTQDQLVERLDRAFAVIMRTNA